MNALFNIVLQTTVSASWLMLAVIVARLILKKAPKSITLFLWLAVGLRLIVPFSIKSSFGLAPSRESVEQGIKSVQQLVHSPAPSAVPTVPVQGFAPDVSNIINDISAYVPELSLPSYPAGNTASEVISRAPATVIEKATENTRAIADSAQTALTVLAVIWLIGVAAMLIYTAVSYAKIRRTVRASIRLTGNIYVCDYIDTPFVLGVFKPRIYIPAVLREENLQYVLEHERTHIKRHDHIWKLLGQFIFALHWFNPLVWISYILFCRDIEFACDEKVIKKYDEGGKADYAQALLDCRAKRRATVSYPVAFGEIGIKERVKKVLKYKKPAIWFAVIAVLACVVLTACFVTERRENNESSDDEPSQVEETVELPKLSDERKDEILKIFTEEHKGYDYERWCDIDSQTAPYDGMRYYGNYGGYDIVMVPGTGGGEYAKPITLNEYKFEHYTTFELFAFGNGLNGERIDEWNDYSFLKEEYIAEMQIIHNRYEELIPKPIIDYDALPMPDLSLSKDKIRELKAIHGQHFVVDVANMSGEDRNNLHSNFSAYYGDYNGYSAIISDHSGFASWWPGEGQIFTTFVAGYEFPGWYLSITLENVNDRRDIYSLINAYRRGIIDENDLAGIAKLHHVFIEERSNSLTNSSPESEIVSYDMRSPVNPSVIDKSVDVNSMTKEEYLDFIDKVTTDYKNKFFDRDLNKWFYGYFDEYLSSFKDYLERNVYYDIGEDATEEQAREYIESQLNYCETDLLKEMANLIDDEFKRLYKSNDYHPYLGETCQMFIEFVRGNFSRFHDYGNDDYEKNKPTLSWIPESQFADYVAMPQFEKDERLYVLQKYHDRYWEWFVLEEQLLTGSLSPDYERPSREAVKGYIDKLKEEGEKSIAQKVVEEFKLVPDFIFIHSGTFDTHMYVLTDEGGNYQGNMYIDFGSINFYSVDGENESWN